MEGNVQQIKPAWLKNAIFYEVYPQSFCDTNSDGIGDLEGIISKLDYIKKLGCNAIWINPCFVSPFKDAGYDITDYLTVDPRYGTNEDLCRLFTLAHEKGMHIILDLVAGHTSDQHKWFLQSGLPLANESTNRYIWTDNGWKMPKGFSGISGRFDRNGVYVVNFFSHQPALNYGFARGDESWQLPYTHQDCLATREAIKKIMRFWLDKGCDGFRVDMAACLVKNDEDAAATAEIWKEIRAMLDKDYPEAILVSEWSDPCHALKCGFHADFYLDHPGNGYNTLFRRRDETSGEPLVGFFSKQGKGDISLFVNDYLQKYENSKDYGYISFITGNHDTARMRRTYDMEELKLAYAFIFTMPGVPFLYYGDEIGMRFIEGLVSKEGGYDRTGSRTPMQWNKEPNYGFSAGPADKLYLIEDMSPDAPTVEAQEGDPESLLNVVKRVLQLRQENQDLQADGTFEVVHAKQGAYPFIYKRGGSLIAVNPSGLPASAPINMLGTVLFSLGVLPERSEAEIIMAPQSFIVVKP
jgi:maltose alpha-D-glucosyltransferase/alpha-amylase